jgi:hypothetical protein
MKRTLLLIIAIVFILPSFSYSQNFWRSIMDYGDWNIYPIGANNNVLLGDKWGTKQLYRNVQPNIYWNIRGPVATIWDIEFFANGHIILAAGEDGAFRSIDDGITWTQIAPSGVEVYDIYISAGIAYCACWGAVYTYNDGANTWQDLEYNWTDIPSSIIFSGQTYVGSDENTIFVDLGGGFWDVVDGVTNYSYADVSELLEVPGTQYALTSEGLYSSAGGWADWSPVTTLQQWDYVKDIVKDELNNVYVYNGLDVVKNVGGVWTPMTSEGMHTTAIKGLAYDLVKNELYAAGEGVYKYNKTENRWDFLGLSPLYLMSSTTDNNNVNYFGSSGAGVIKVENDTAKVKNNGLNFGVISSIASDANNNIYAGSELGGLYKSTDHGDSWSITDTILPGNKIRAIVIDNSDNIYAGTYGNGVFKSQGSDESWIQKNNGLSNTFVAALAYSSDLNTLFAGTHSNGVFYSTDGGGSWQATALDNSDVHGLTVNTTGDVIAATQSGLFKINNNSNSWDNYETLISDTTFQTIGINKSGVLFAGTALYGALLSYDNGNEWVEQNSGFVINGLPVRSMTTFTFDQKGYAFAGTIGGGIFKSTDSITDIKENGQFHPELMYLEQNYPNPFSHTTSISYKVPQYSKVILKVYDIVGKEVATLVNKDQAAGSYKVEFIADKLPGGVYTYSLVLMDRKGNIVQTKKMIHKGKSD